MEKFIQHIEIYKTGKKVYHYYINTSNLLRNGYNYPKNYIQGKHTTPFLNSIKRDWNSKYNLISKIPILNIQNNRYSNYKSILDKGKYIYQKGREYYDKGRHIYQEYNWYLMILKWKYQIIKIQFKIIFQK